MQVSKPRSKHSFRNTNLSWHFFFHPLVLSTNVYLTYLISKSNLWLIPKCSIQVLITHLSLLMQSIDLIRPFTCSFSPFWLLHSHNTTSHFRETIGYNIHTWSFGMSQGICVLLFNTLSLLMFSWLTDFVDFTLKSPVNCNNIYSTITQSTWKI